MSLDQDTDRVDGDDEEHEAPVAFHERTAFRVVAVVVVVGAVAALSVPYVLNSLAPARPVVTGTATPEPPKLDTTPVPQATSQTSETATPPPAARATAAAPSAKSEQARPSAPTTAPRVKTSANTAREPKPSTPAAPSKQERRPEAAGTPKPDVAGSAADARAPGSAADTDTTLGSETGTYWVQVGAFRDPDTAKRVAAKLQEQRFRVEEMTIAGSSTPAASPGSPAEGASDRYDVFVASGAPADVVTKLTSKGLSAEAVTDGAIVKPSLPLRDAVALSKDLASEGFKVQVKRARTAVAGAPASSTRAATGEAALHRVRVGAFADRAAAAAAMKKLEALGYTTFLARGGK